MDAAAAELVREGKPLEALDALKAQIRGEPAEPRHRVFLFQLLSVLGDWDRAADQLQVAAELDGTMLVLANVYRAAVRAEKLRAEVFAGQRSPLILGEPEAWIGDMLEAVRVLGEDAPAEAMDLRDRALEQAPAVPGRITIGESEPVSFEWIADCDSRTGPMLEMIVEGKYYWVPLSRVRLLQIDAPTDLRDLVWLPCNVVWENGGDATALIPARYPGVTQNSDTDSLMARAASWAEPVPGYLVGSGARTLVTDSDECLLLDVRRVEFDQPEGAERDGG